MTNKHNTRNTPQGEGLPDPETLLPENPFAALHPDFWPPENEIAPQPMDFRRTMAAFNACQAISTEALEDGVVADMLKALRAIRLVMPEAMKALMAKGGDGLLMADKLHRADDQARAAIAKAEGKA